MVLVKKCDDDGNRFVKARLNARGDQDPELLSLVRNQQTSAPTFSTNGKVVTLQVISAGTTLSTGERHGAPSKTKPRVDVALPSSVIGKLAVGDAYERNLSKRLRKKVTSWLHHRGD